MVLFVLNEGLQRGNCFFLSRQSTSEEANSELDLFFLNEAWDGKLLRSVPHTKRFKTSLLWRRTDSLSASPRLSVLHLSGMQSHKSPN